MARRSPLLRQHQQAEALLTPYGPADPQGQTIDVVQTFGELELEYAALRRPTHGCALLDLPNRATLEVTGPDRLDFLNRMLTQELKGFPEGTVRESFWLSRKGRIDADLRLLNLPDRLLIDVDAHAADTALRGLSQYLITEDCAIFDRTDEFHRLALHGTSAAAVLDAALGPISRRPNAAPAPPAATDRSAAQLQPGEIAVRQMGAHVVIIDRADAAGVPGFNLLLRTDAVQPVYERLLAEGGYDSASDHAAGSALQPRARTLGLRPIGWAAFNIARIEAGTPFYFLDFGPEALPAETSLLDRRVSFTKGCYLGQEIVARMHALGSPKQRLVAFRMPPPTLPAPKAPGEPYEPPVIPQPITGAAVFLAVGDAQTTPRPSELGDPVGVVTSSCVSPMLGQTPIGLAMLKFKHAEPGTRLWIECEGTLLPATVQPTLAQWTRPTPG
jgi:folate-binding protein YgfZ